MEAKAPSWIFLFWSFDNDHQKVWTFHFFTTCTPNGVKYWIFHYIIFRIYIWTHWYSGKIDSYVYWVSKVTIINSCSVSFCYLKYILSYPVIHIKSGLRLTHPKYVCHTFPSYLLTIYGQFQAASLLSRVGGGGWGGGVVIIRIKANSVRLD